MRALLLLGMSGCVLWAQIPGPGPIDYQDLPYQIAYATSLASGDAVFNITNTGATGAQFNTPANNNVPTTGSICANVYAFAPDEQMISCCSCAVTPNGLRSLSVRRDLLNNTLTPAVPSSVVVKLVASFPNASGSCVNSAADPLGVTQGTGATRATSAATLPMGMRAWMTTTHNLPGSTVQTTEFPFSPATLSADLTVPGQGLPSNLGELGRLRHLCTFIQANGSGFGICNSCLLGGLGGTRR